MGKKRGAKGNKSQAIRDFMDANPDAGPLAVSEALKGQGIDVSAQFVSTIKSLDRKKSGAPARRRGRTVAVKAGAHDKISMKTLIQAKKMAEQMGGVDKAKAALDALARLLD